MKRSDAQAGRVAGQAEDGACTAPPVSPASVPAGIVRTQVDAGSHSLSLDYEPHLISDEGVRQVAARLGPEAQRRFDKCLLHLGVHERRLTNRSVMGPFVLTRRGAWEGYERLGRDERVVFLEEPTDLEKHWRQLTRQDSIGHKTWTDAYLAGFAISGRIPLVTFDRGFR